MTIETLRELLEEIGIDKSMYSLYEGARDFCYMLEKTHGTIFSHKVYYVERGLISPERLFKSESDACQHLWYVFSTDRGIARDEKKLAEVLKRLGGQR